MRIHLSFLCAVVLPKLSFALAFNARGAPSRSLATLLDFAFRSLAVVGIMSRHFSWLTY
jgi:hypothetical protein